MRKRKKVIWEICLWTPYTWADGIKLPIEHKDMQGKGCSTHRRFRTAVKAWRYFKHCPKDSVLIQRFTNKKLYWSTWTRL